MAKHYFKLSERLQHLLYKKRLNISELAREVDLPIPTVHRLVSGKSTRPYKSSLKPIADYFSISIDQLLGEKDLPNNPWQAEVSQNGHQLHEVPIISWLETTDLLRATKSSKHSIITTGNISDQCFALISYDYSMEPMFMKNSILIFDKIKEPNDRSFVLVKLHSIKQPIFRQLLIDIDKWFLKALNPELSTSIRELTKDDEIIATLFESRFCHESENSEKLIEG